MNYRIRKTTVLWRGMVGVAIATMLSECPAMMKVPQVAMQKGGNVPQPPFPYTLGKTSCVILSARMDAERMHANTKICTQGIFRKSLCACKVGAGIMGALGITALLVSSFIKQIDRFKNVDCPAFNYGALPVSASNTTFKKRSVQSSGCQDDYHVVDQETCRMMSII